MYELWVDYSVWCRFILGNKYSCEVKLLSRAQLFNPVDCSPPGSFVHGIL